MKIVLVLVKIAVALLPILVVAWLGLWAAGIGVLFYSVETSVAKIRDCRYVVGVTIVKRTVLVADYCPFLNK